MLADDFHADGALSGDNVGVVEGRDVSQAAFGHQSDGVVVGIVVGSHPSRKNLYANMPAITVD